MPTRKRIRIQAPGGGGGGTTPTFGNVVWGPDFGENSDGVSHTIGVTAQPIDTVGLENTQGIGVSMDIDTALVLYNDQSIGVNADLDSAGVVFNDQSIGTNMDLDSVGLENTQGVGCNMDLDMALVLYNDQSIGVHNSGDALGAPFWQSVAVNAQTNALGDAGMTIAKPSGLAVGDLMIAAIASSGTSVATRTGWTEIHNTPNGSGPIITSLWKVADSADVAASDFAFTLSPTSINTMGELHRIIGQDATTPINAATEATGSATDPIAPAVTTSSVNCLVLAVAAHTHVLGSETNTPPASHIERTDFTAGTVLPVNLSTASRVFAATGSQAAVTFDCSILTSQVYAAQRIAIAPGTLVLAA